MSKLVSTIDITYHIFRLGSDTVSVASLKSIKTEIKDLWEYRNDYFHGMLLKGEYAFKELDKVYELLKPVLSIIGDNIFKLTE